MNPSKKVKQMYQWKELEAKQARYYRDPAPALSDESNSNFAEQILGEKLRYFKSEKDLAAYQRHWLEIAGPLSRHSMPERVNAHKLYVRVEKSVYAQELSLYMPQLLEKARKYGSNDLKRIYIETGKINWLEHPERKFSPRQSEVNADKGPVEVARKVSGEKADISDAGLELIQGLQNLRSH